MGDMGCKLEVSTQEGVSSARKGAIFPTLLAFPGASSSFVEGSY